MLTVTLNVLSLFAGIGGLELGLERAGMTTVGQVEIDPFCQRVLAKHWPEVPRHDDVRTAGQWWGGAIRPPVDLVCGGFPCQPVSDAGRQLAQQDPRWLWGPMRDVIAYIRPAWVVAENVPGLRTRGLSIVLADLRRLGYAARAGEISACEMGAPHPRRRLFILAHPEGERRWPWTQGHGKTIGADGLRARGGPERRGWWSTEPDVDRMAYGVPNGVDRRRALGNAIVPAVAEHIGRLIVGAQHERVAA